MKMEGIKMDPGQFYLRVSGNRRFLVHEDGQPFFWLGDTAWELFHRLSREECKLYLDSRAEKGFTVIQAVVLAELDGLRVPNAYGHLPLVEEDPLRPSEDYFQHVDWVIREARKRGLFIALLPTWADKVNRKYDWAKGPEIFTDENAFSYGSWLAARYALDPNIIFVLGGDRDPDQRGQSIWRAMAAGIREGEATGKRKLMTFHPQPFEGGSSSRWFHHDEWLNFNMLQTGHDRDTPVFDQIAHEYALRPAKPVIDGEPTYEAHGIAFKPSEKGYAQEADVRKMAYWNVFAGAFGHTYGCHSIWQFYTGEGEGINYPIFSWRDALHLAGAAQMQWLKKLMLSRPFTERIPDQGLLAVQPEAVADHQVATRGEKGDYAFIYTPTGRSIACRTRELAGETLRCTWYSPREGISTVANVLKKEPLMVFQPPTEGQGCDWVLVIDAIS
jgi:hypothetical protein